MGWARFDDRYSEHPKVVAAGPMAELIDRRAIEYCARQETDGFVIEQQVKLMCADLVMDLGIDWRDPVQRLLEVGRWVEADGGYEIHDYLDYNPAKAKKESEREAARERMARARGNKRRSSAEHPPNSQRSAGNPDPTPPEPQQELHGDADASADALPDDEPPREATGDWTYSRTLAEWAVANGHDPPDTGDNRTELTRWLLGLIRPAPDATAEQLKTARGLGRTIVVDYLTHATGTSPPNEFWGYLGRLIATSGVDAVFDAVVVAVESGAGLTPPHNDNPLSLLKYATAVKNRSSR